MHGNTLGYIIWAGCALLFAGMGIYCFFAKKPARFWANTNGVEVEDMKGYNRAMGILWIGFGAYFALIGLPLLFGNLILTILVSMLGTVAGTIGLMAVYTAVISKKYNVRQK